jgi:hypothetical protein
MFAEPMALDRKMLEVSQGLAKTFPRKVFSDQGYAITGFTGSELLSVEVWMGDTGRIVRHADDASAQWTVPSGGEYQISLPALNIDKGIYSIRAVLDPNGGLCYDDKREIYRGYLKVNASPVDTLCDPLKSYCSYQDLLEKAPWLESTHVDGDLSGFARHRHRAREWIDEAISRNAPSTSWNASNVVFYGLYPPGYSTRGRAQYMLQNNYLVVTPQIRDAAAHYAIWLICDALSSTPTTGSYGEIAAKHKTRANSIMQSMVASFSEDGKSVNFSIDMRIVSGRTYF